LERSEAVEETMTLKPMANDLIIALPASAATLAGFRAWTRSDRFPERGRISFISQEIVIDMSPERLDTHNKVKTEIIRVLANLNVENDLGNLYSDRTSLVNEGVGLLTEPDATFATWQSFETGKIRAVPSETNERDFIELEGTPDWVLEIVSPGSVQKDTKQLREKYYRAGISEYWLIDARSKTILFDVLHPGTETYVKGPRRGGWSRSFVFGRFFRLKRRRDRLGQWQYRLEVKAK
jgi:Uma2 family endonuclease